MSHYIYMRVTHEYGIRLLITIVIINILIRILFSIKIPDIKKYKETNI